MTQISFSVAGGELAAEAGVASGRRELLDRLPKALGVHRPDQHLMGRDDSGALVYRGLDRALGV